MREHTVLADSSRKKYLTIFKIALKEILKGSPESFSIIEQVKIPRPEDKEVRAFSLKEQKLIEHAALDSKDKRAAGIILCFYTGIRLGELCSLKWGDIDMERGTLSIGRTGNSIPSAIPLPPALWKWAWMLKPSANCWAIPACPLPLMCIPTPLWSKKSCH